MDVKKTVARCYAEWVAETHAIELRAYEATVQNQAERIRQLESELERLRKDAESYRRLVDAARAEGMQHCVYPDCTCPDGISTGSCNLGLPDAAIAGEKK